MPITHAFESAAAANANPAKIDGPKWNAEHVFDLSIADIDGLEDALGGKSDAAHTHAAYALTSHDHASVYAALVHNHDAAYASISHHHDASYAAIAHTHTGVYEPADTTLTALAALAANGLAEIAGAGASASVRTIGVGTSASIPTRGDADTRYSAAAHNHDGLYAATTHAHSIGDVTSLQASLDGKSATSHNHDGVYATAAHNHDAAYSLIDHTHPGGSPPTGVFSDIQISVLQAPFTLAAASGVQAAFPAAQDVFTLAANSTYRVTGKYLMATGTTTHTTALAWALSGATVASFEYLTNLWSAAANTISTAQSSCHVTGVASKVINATSTAVRTMIEFEGIMVTTNGGAVTPQIAFSANPTGTNQMLRGSYVTFELLGANTATKFGGWA